MKPTFLNQLARTTGTGRLRVGVALAAMASMSFGCGDGDRKPAHLDVAANPDVADDTDEWLSQQRQLTISYVDAWGNVTEDTSPTPVEVYGALNGICSKVISNESSGCLRNLQANVQWHICMAKGSLALATPQSDAITLPDPFVTNGKMVVDRVTEANAADFARVASDFARWAIAYSAQTLKTGGSCKSGGVWQPAPPAKPLSLDYATALVEAYYLGLAAMERAVEATVNVSDEARSSTSSPEVAEERAILGVQYSRAAAAHLLVGGSDGLLGSTTTGYCLKQDLAPGPRAALQLLRDAAPPVSLLLNNDISALLNSDQTEGSVRQRLGKFYGLTTLQGATGMQTVEQYYDLTTQDFLKARDYLRQEVNVFSRSSTAKSPAPIPDMTGYSRYGGTSGDRVKELPPGAWSARARHLNTTPSPWYDSTTGVFYLDPHGFNPAPNINDPTPPLESLIAGTHIAILDILRLSDTYSNVSGAPASNDHSNEVNGILASILTSGDYKGVIELRATSTSLAANAHGYSAADKVRIVAGEDGLRCAVEGTIEGMDCDDSLTGAQWAATPLTACTAKPASLSCLTAVVLGAEQTSTSNPYYGNNIYANGARSTAMTTSIVNKTRFYAVKPKTGLLEKPGNFELLGGSSLKASYWVAIPVIPSLDRKVAKVLAPNRKNCAVPSVNCLGKAFDARLPLEDELTGDGDNVESSWKHYLELAKQAAAESDVLGREFRDLKLNKLQGEALAAQRKEEQLQAAETALEEVQALCGTAVDSRRLVEYLSGGQNGSNLDGVAGALSCPTTACPADSVCRSGRCVKDLSKLTAPGSGFENDPDARRLADCLATGPLAVEKFVTLGSKELCVYSTPQRPTDVCPTTLNGAACPAVKPDAGCTAIANHEVSVAKPLSYFQNKDPAVSDPAFNACDAFRRARKSRTNGISLAGLETALYQVTNSDVFYPGRLSHTVGRLGFRAKLGGFFDITEDGTKRWSSGDVTVNPNRTTTEWPHILPAACNPAVHDGLFCTNFPATNNTQIAAMHKRVLEAVFAATAIKRAMDPTKFAMDIHFPSDGGWSVKSPTAISIFKQPENVPIVETKYAADSRGQRTTYGTASVPLWVKHDGTAIATTAMNLWGPADPNTEKSDAEFTAKLIPKFCAGACFEWVLSVLSGQKAEDEGKGVAMGYRDASLLQYMIAAAPALPVTEDITGFVVGYNYPDTTFSSRSILDGYELLCELDRAHQSPGNQPLGLATSLSGMNVTAEILKRFGEQIERRGAFMVFADVPAAAAVALEDSPPNGGFTELRGEMGQAVSELKTAMIETRHALPTIASQLAQMGNAITTLTAQLSTVEASKELSELNAWSTALNQATECAKASDAIDAITTFGVTTAATCANSIAQTAIAFRKSSLEKTIHDNEATIAKAQFGSLMAQYAEVMQKAALGLETAMEQVSAALYRIESMRKQANLALAKAVYMASYQSTQQLIYDKATGSLSDLAQRRYIEALKNAKLMSFFARRAIEQRLGVDLTEMRDELPLVEAPENWEGEACTMSGVQPDAGSSASEQAENTGAWIATYGKGFIGDYVNKLEKVVESYRLVNNFHEGQDVAVISLRDDVANVRAACDMPSRNLLRYDLSSPEGWSARSCNSVTVGGVAQPSFNCIGAVSSPNYTPPSSTVTVPDVAVKGVVVPQTGGNGYILRFGEGTGSCPAGNCGWKNGSALSQIVDLKAGKYRLSWYTRDAGPCTVTATHCAAGFTCTSGLCLPSYTNAAKSGIVRVRGYTNAAGVTTPNPATPTNFVAPQDDDQAGDRCSTSNIAAGCALGKGWRRASIEFTITVPGEYEVGFGVAQTTIPTTAQEVTIGAPMLETVPANGAATYMTPYQLADGEGMTPIHNCEDTEGVRFRREHWSRQCVHLCDNGFSDNCSKGPEYCYQEFTFGVSQPWIATGKLFKYSGFARGNYNYRIDSLALNFVGSHTRDCEDATLPSTCYNAGFIPYSIHHLGPFYTRNHEGADVEAMLFDGKIEHARGLALERYVTNPISSTDRELMADYMRKELAGRPLDGTFVIRMWEEPGVNLEAVQDVQLVLNYRYWTAFN